MRIGVVSAYLPYPLDSGGNTAVFHMVRGLSLRHEVVAVVGLYQPEQEAYVEPLRQAWGNVQVIPVHTSVLAPRGIRPFTYSPSADFSSTEMVQAIGRLDRERRVDLFEFTYFRIAALASQVTNSPSVFVELEIPHVRLLRSMASTSNWLLKWQYMKNAYIARSEEKRLYRRFKKVLVLSPTDKEQLLKLDKQLDVGISPFGVDTEALTPLGTENSMPHLVYIGGESHPPNVDAVRYFVSEILPAIRQTCPDLRLEVVGRWSDRTKHELDVIAYNGIKWFGFVEDLRSALEGAILVAPIRIGSGLRTKILEAMATGCSVVSTSVGCEGIPAVSGESIFIENHPKAFASQVIRLWHDPELRRTMGEKGRSLIQREYGLDVVVRKREAFLEEVVRNVVGKVR